MQSEETVSQAYTPCKVIEMAEFGGKKKDQLENWLKEQIHEKYGDRDEITVKNPLIRLSTKFEALSDVAQCELYGIAKRAALGNRGKMSMSKEFWKFFEMQPAAWEDIEEIADKLLLKEKVYKQAAGGSLLMECNPVTELGYIAEDLEHIEKGGAVHPPAAKVHTGKALHFDKRGRSRLTKAGVYGRIQGSGGKMFHERRRYR